MNKTGIDYEKMAKYDVIDQNKSFKQSKLVFMVNMVNMVFIYCKIL